MLDYKTKIELITLGVRTSIPPRRRGGGGPIGGIGFAVNGSIVSAPTKQWYVKESPYEIVEREGKFILLREDERIGYVEIPKAEYYKHTIKGVSAGFIVALDGINALVTSVSRRCVHVDSGKKCIFCAIEKNVTEPFILDKNPGDIVEAVKVAYEEDRTRHLTLTTGTTNLIDKGALKISEVARKVKEEVDIKIHAQVEAVNEKYLEVLYSSGVDTIGIHIETFDEKIRGTVVPGKPSIEEYLKCWREAVKLFGEWKVSSWIVIGLGEREESVVDGFKRTAEEGVIPYVAPFRPPPDDLVTRPDLKYIMRIYERLRDLRSEYDVKIEKCDAGCPKCTGCSAILETLS
ncbi:MAG: hypothetical protein DSO07_08945 [Thermoproteota archaeon]|jgi:radical SAM protein (TIGR04043 family)|uniref:Radical SAM protein n=1 Tax=Candidatus Methanodesulfokora washburnensis TaxID=2478471 RepID=A0A3R9QUZ3_9CREN|nr:radical SAM protein [Candidatus Methanodesulfokores washburnensis]RSN72802.1 radical SAM protein [Candidatus Methanodesulfokores washburnensis]RZN62167.1 MAG: radical SAM protein [Candidatus Methanodesulfokores washburnensis]TDA40594.1 MAG: hypothetical protein DSO07_08945 [Candidatus Korarchaeota archaeon]